MKPRRVVVILEIITDKELGDLRKRDLWWQGDEIEQVQVNVVKARPRHKKRRAR